MRTPREVIDFWFGNTINGSIDDINARMGLWFFRKSPEFEEVQLIHASLLKTLDADIALDVDIVGASLDIDRALWDTKSSSEAAMATVIVFDQFSRCVHRGSREAFAMDRKSAAIINYIVKRGDWLLEKYSPIERFFLCVGIQHSESLVDQETGVKVVASSIGHGASSEIGTFFASLKGFPHEHYEVVKRFGRFPHRNELFERESTAEETGWLESEECPGWAKSQKKSSK